MLVRAFRLTDKLTNALLRFLIWTGDSLLRQVYEFRTRFLGFLATMAFMLTETLQSGRAVYETSAERRRAIMARRAEELATRTILREDPLKSQNRALSLFTVLLLALLIVLVLWTTGQNSGRPTLPPAAGGPLPIEPTKPSPTPQPSVTATMTPPPDPLRVGGSIVYSMRQNGRENLWVIGIGQTQPIQLTNTPVDDRDPAWSPDGTRIAFASRRGGNWDLYLLEVATGATTRLTFSPDYKAAPTWSPDGNFIAYEGYKDNNLDIYVIPSNGQGQPQRLTTDPAPDFSPAWNPGGEPVRGRQIAYTSLRDGNAEIYVINLDRPIEYEALRLTNTPDIDEDAPSWSPDGKTIAYSALTNGLDLVFTKSVEKPNEAPLTIGRGRQPAWAPNGQSLVFALDTTNGATTRTTFVGGLAGGVGVSALAISLPARANRPNWANVSLPDSLVKSGGVSAAVNPLYAESVEPRRAQPPYYQFRVLAGVRAPVAALSDRVDGSFLALRQRVLLEAGADFLGTLQDALWGSDRLPELGQSRQSWHYAGRAFALVRTLVYNDPAQVEIVREDIGASTYWRVYIRVDESAQNGRLGEPLKRYPWDVASRTSDPQAFESGGRKKSVVPPGYYVDLTQLAEDYGWERVPADLTWRSNFNGMLYWEFDKRDSLNWNDAMLELFSQQDIDNFLFGPTPIPTRTPGPTETPVPRRSPTPIPPDQS